MATVAFARSAAQMKRISPSNQRSCKTATCQKVSKETVAQWQGLYHDWTVFRRRSENSSCLRAILQSGHFLGNLTGKVPIMSAMDTKPDGVAATPAAAAPAVQQLQFNDVFVLKKGRATPGRIRFGAQVFKFKVSYITY